MTLDQFPDFLAEPELDSFIEYVGILLLRGKPPTLAGKQVVEMAKEVGGTTNDDPGPISQGPHAFWLISFLV